jgi:hypothetical protein
MIATSLGQGGYLSEREIRTEGRRGTEERGRRDEGTEEWRDGGTGETEEWEGRRNRRDGGTEGRRAEDRGTEGRRDNVQTKKGGRNKEEERRPTWAFDATTPDPRKRSEGPSTTATEPVRNLQTPEMTSIFLNLRSPWMIFLA